MAHAEIPVAIDGDPAHATVSCAGDGVARGGLVADAADAAESPSDSSDRAGKRGRPVLTDSDSTNDLFRHRCSILRSSDSGVSRRVRLESEAA